MKLRSAVVWALMGMVGSSAAAMRVPVSAAPAAPVTTAATREGAQASAGPLATADAAAVQPRFSAGGPADHALTLDARLGHASVPQSASAGDARETFLFASVAGTDTGLAGATAPTDLALVVDRSGSMRGARLAHAIAAATGVVDRLRDGDRVTVVAFDDDAEVIVPPTFASAATRPSIDGAIRALRARGDTCMSCGLEAAMRALDGARSGGIGVLDEVDRVILLSDGAANKGIRDVAGLRALAARMRDRGCAVTTVGLDVDSDPRVMTDIAAESNGRHVFVADARDLAQVFDAELDSVLATVARDAELVIDPAPGVEIAEVLDRAFRREGDRVVVPLGTFAPKQEKTALLRLRVAADHEGAREVASVSLRFRDLAQRRDDALAGALSFAVAAPDAAPSPVDPFVQARVERSRTAHTLNDANLLFEQGFRAEARRKLAAHASEIQTAALAATAAAQSAPAPKPTAAKDLEDDFQAQARAIASADRAFAAPPPAKADSFGAGRGGGGASAVAGATATPVAPQDTREGKKAVRENANTAFDLSF